MRRIAVLFLCTLVLWTIVAQLNHTISPWHVYLFAGGLFVAFTSLTQPFSAGWWGAVLSGFVLDANAPIAFGKHMVLFVAAHMVLFRIRDRIAGHDTISRVTVAVLTNLALFLVFSFLQLLRTPAIAAIWPRLICDLLCSQLFIALVAPWYFAFQARALVVARLERENFA